MPIADIPDWKERIARHDAFWRREIIDRPVICITIPKPQAQAPAPPQRTYGGQRERWLDADGAAQRALAAALTHDCLGDALPHAYPFIGAEVFSAFFGLELEYSPDTAWSVPCLRSWEDVANLRFDPHGFYWRKVVEFTDAFLAAGGNRFYCGITDLHNGADAIAAFRDPAQLNLDLLDAPDQVRSLLGYLDDVYARVYDYFQQRLTAAAQPICTWMPIVSTKKWYVVSNDFSCMISSRMFDDIFLPCIVAECRRYQACIYHLDGPGALRHLDSLLAIPEINAIQWVQGAGHGGIADWMWLYQRCQAAGKGLYLDCGTGDLDLLMSRLRPQGMLLQLWGPKDRTEAETVLKEVARWR